MRLVGFVVLAVLASPCLAQEGMYVGAAVGSFDYSDDSGFLAPGTFSDTVSAWRFYGGFEFNENVAVEIRYGGTGEMTYSESGTDPVLGDYTATIDTDISVTSVLGIGMLPKDWGVLIGGLGYFSSSADADLALTTGCCGGFNVAGSDDDNGLAAVIGVEWRFGRFGTGVGLRLEYEWLDFDDADASTIGIGVAYRF